MPTAPCAICTACLRHQALRKIVPALCSMMVCDDKLVLSDGETAYWLHLLGHALRRAGGESLVYRKEIEEVLSLTLTHEERPVYKQAQKVLPLMSEHMSKHMSKHMCIHTLIAEWPVHKQAAECAAAKWSLLLHVQPHCK